MLTVYGLHYSRASRVFWLLEEIGMDFKPIPVIHGRFFPDPNAPGTPFNTRCDEYLAISPSGTMPVIQDGDLTLSESMAINLYLAKTYGGLLGPQVAKDEAKVLQWTLFGAEVVEPPVLEVYYAKNFQSDNEETIALALAKAEKPLSVIEKCLIDGNGHLLANRFTVADLNMSQVLRHITEAGPVLENYPAISAWLSACDARPAFQKVLAIREAQGVAFRARDWDYFNVRRLT